MKFLQYIKDSYTHVFAVDAEYEPDITKTIPKRVVCVVYTDVFTGRVYPFWENNNNGSSPRHFEYEDVLLISYNATAEVGSYLNLFHGRPLNVWDAYIENNRLYKHIRNGKGANTLLGTAEYYGIKDKISELEKQENINLIINNENYTPSQEKRILKYCQSDTETLRQIFIKQVEDIEDNNKLKTDKDFKRELWQILNRGRAIGCGALIERTAIPLDLPLLKKVKTYWPLVKNKLIRRFNKEVGVFTDDLVFKHDRFDEIIIKNNLAHKWLRMKNGHFTTNKNYLKKFTHIPIIKKINEIRGIQSLDKLLHFGIGEDGRARTNINMFETITSRTKISSKSPFGASKWVRNFIKPSWGNYLVYLDYVSNEPAIAAYLSGDPEMLKIYQSGEDVNITAAKHFKMVPDNATKQSHPRERKIFKELYFAGLYGAGPGYLVKKLGVSMTKAKKLQSMFREKFKIYFNWIESIVEGALVHGKIETFFGWQRYIKDLWVYNQGRRKPIRNSLLNWPIQSHGAEVLRRAIINLTDEFFEICTTVHDAVLIQIPIPDFKSRVNLAKEIMVRSSIEVIGGPIRVDHETITGNFIQAPEDQIFFDEIMKEIEIYKGTPVLGDGVHPNREHPPILL